MSKQKGLPAFGKKLGQLNEVFAKLPHKAGQIAVDHSHKNFANESFGNGGNTSKWKPRKQKPKGGQRNLLVQNGYLRGSIDYEAGIMQTTIGSDKPYAKVHNEGGKAGRGKGFQMPKRQFMGPSGDIDNAIGEWLDGQFDKIFK